MPISIYNTLSQKKEGLPKTKNKPLRLFVCGPTVYNHIHIGNARTYAVFDTFVKYLRSRKIRVEYLQNITDIDDKIITRASEEKKSWKKIAQTYTASYRKTMKALRVNSVNTYAPATKYIPEIIKQAQTLIKKDHAYEIPGDGWYFDLKTFPDYGKLAKRTVEQAEDGISRIDSNPRKRNRGDFCLWKFSKKGEPIWKAPFGDGRPGWHIEDTAITEKYFGPQYDLHGGGRDLIFPHHEAEIAQAESASDKKPFVKIWMHAGFLTAKGGEKMSKSLGNFMTVTDLLQKTDPNVFRFIVAGAHYRSPLEYSAENEHDASRALGAIRETLAKLELVQASGRGNQRFSVKKFEDNFNSSMDDDFNSPKALSAIFEFINTVNQSTWNLKKQDANTAAKWLKDKLAILGVEVKPLKIPAKIKSLATKRELFRSNKQFAESDVLRKEIEQLGYKIEDTPLGPMVLKKNYGYASQDSSAKP